MEKAYSKTTRLKGAKFRGQKSLVVEVLARCAAPITLNGLVPMVDENGRYNALLNDWAKENGGVRGSVLYHLRALKRLGMVEESLAPTAARTQIVGWGNSQAVRIPREMLDALQVREGDEVELVLENGRLMVQPVNPKLTLELLVAAITPENRHKEVDWGKPVGNEAW